jgi:formate dehydrogenase iron-sulfur subunit
MKKLADSRIEDLKSRGYENAGLYDPSGVGGTHVMYVLHHNDKPEIYAGLPKDPTISPVVNAWKGVAKYVGFAALGLAAAAGMLHSALAGPNRVTREDEEKAEDLVKEKT